MGTTFSPAQLRGKICPPPANRRNTRNQKYSRLVILAFIGLLVDGKRHGLGTLKDKNGKILKKGRFVNDEYVGP